MLVKNPNASPTLDPATFAPLAGAYYADFAKSFNAANLDLNHTDSQALKLFLQRLIDNLNPKKSPPPPQPVSQQTTPAPTDETDWITVTGKKAAKKKTLEQTAVAAMVCNSFEHENLWASLTVEETVPPKKKRHKRKKKKKKTVKKLSEGEFNAAVQRIVARFNNVLNDTGEEKLPWEMQASDEGGSSSGKEEEDSQASTYSYYETDGNGNRTEVHGHNRASRVDSASGVGESSHSGRDDDGGDDTPSSTTIPRSKMQAAASQFIAHQLGSEHGSVGKNLGWKALDGICVSIALLAVELYYNPSRDYSRTETMGFIYAISSMIANSGPNVWGALGFTNYMRQRFQKTGLEAELLKDPNKAACCEKFKAAAVELVSVVGGGASVTGFVQVSDTTNKSDLAGKLLTADVAAGMWMLHYFGFRMLIGEAWDFWKDCPLWNEYGQTRAEIITNVFTQALTEAKYKLRDLSRAQRQEKTPSYYLDIKELLLDIVERNCEQLLSQQCFQPLFLNETETAHQGNDDARDDVFAQDTQAILGEGNRKQRFKKRLVEQFHSELMQRFHNDELISNYTPTDEDYRGWLLQSYNRQYKALNPRQRSDILEAFSQQVDMIKDETEQELEQHAEDLVNELVAILESPQAQGRSSSSSADANESTPLTSTPQGIPSMRQRLWEWFGKYKAVIAMLGGVSTVIGLAGYDAEGFQMAKRFFPHKGEYYPIDIFSDLSLGWLVYATGRDVFNVVWDVVSDIKNEGFKAAMNKFLALRLYPKATSLLAIGAIAVSAASWATNVEVNDKEFQGKTADFFRVFAIYSCVLFNGRSITNSLVNKLLLAYAKNFSKDLNARELANRDEAISAFTDKFSAMPLKQQLVVLSHLDDQTICNLLDGKLPRNEINYFLEEIVAQVQRGNLLEGQGFQEIANWFDERKTAPVSAEDANRDYGTDTPMPASGLNSLV